MPDINSPAARDSKVSLKQQKTSSGSNNQIIQVGSSQHCNYLFLMFHDAWAVNAQETHSQLVFASISRVISDSALLSYQPQQTMQFSPAHFLCGSSMEFSDSIHYWQK